MSENVIMPLPSGPTYIIPDVGDFNWGQNLTDYLVAIPAAMVPTIGTFTLTGNLSFGDTYGLSIKYIQSGDPNPATAGHIRLANTNTIQWRNVANSGNDILSVDTSDNLLWNGSIINATLGSLSDGKMWIGSSGNLPVAQTLTGDVTVSDLGVTAIGAGKIVDAQINNSAAIAYTKLNLSGSITNADIYSSAAIATTKLAALSASIVPVTDVSGFLTNSSTTVTELGYVHGVTSSIQTQLNAKATSTLASGDIFVGNVSNVATAVAMSGDATLANTGALTLATVNASPGSTTLSSITTNAKGLVTANTSASTTGTGNVVLANSPTLVTPALGTPSAIVLTNATGTVTNLTLVTPALGTPSALVLTNATGLPTTSLTGSIVLTSQVSGILPVANGGSGDSSHTAYAVLTGGTTTTGVVQSVASVGTTGQVLTSNGASALPTWQSVSGSGTVNTGTIGQNAVYTGTTAVSSGLTMSMNSNKIINIANGTASTDAATFGQIKVIQAGIQTTSSTPVTTTSSTFTAATNQTVTITPSSSSNRIRITVSTYGESDATGTNLSVTLKRGSTELSGVTNGFATLNATAGNIVAPISFTYIDSPASTSALTYQVFFRSSNNVGTVQVGSGGILSTIIAAEIV